MLDRINKICAHLEISLEELSRRIDVDPGIWKLYDSGEIEIDDDIAFRICLLGGYSPMWIKYGERDPEASVLGPTVRA